MEERPNTIHSLIAKRAELVRWRGQLVADLQKITCDLDHLEACIDLFDPDNTPAAIKGYTTKHRAKKGHVRSFVISFLRRNPGFHTSKTITEAWIADRGLRADEATYVILRKRLGACLTNLRADGLAANGPMDGEYKTWGRPDRPAPIALLSHEATDG